MKNKKLFTFPPEITQYFNEKLLSFPCKFYDDSETLWKIFDYIQTNLMKKCRNYPIKLNKCLNLIEEFIELYEQAKAKEEKLKNEGKNHPKRPFYWIDGFDKGNEEIFRRLKYKAY